MSEVPLYRDSLPQSAAGGPALVAYRGTSLIKNSAAPSKYDRALGIVLLKGG
jgi:hypothetical protein